MLGSLLGCVGASAGLCWAHCWAVLGVVLGCVGDEVFYDVWTASPSATAEVQPAPLTIVLTIGFIWLRL